MADGTIPSYKAKPSTSPAALSEKFKVDANTINAITLDKCDYYFDSVLQEKD